MANSSNTRTGSSELSTRDRAAEADPLGLRGDRGERDRRRRDREVGAVVLADAEHVEPELVGQLGFLEQVLQPLLGRDRPDVGEGDQSELHASR